MGLPRAERGDKLIYAQNWEDPLLEMEALRIQPQDRVLAVAGGGCTALSLLAQGPAELIAVDCSVTQLRVLALKRVLVCELEPREAEAFLLGTLRRREWQTAWVRVSAALDEGALEFWSSRRRWLRKGVLHQGRAEKFLAVLGRLVRAAIHPRRRIAKLLSLSDMGEQRRYYHQHWNRWRWRLLFRALRKRTVDQALDPTFYRHVEPGNFGEQLRQRAERRLLTLPACDNYFLSRMLLGEFLPGPSGRPPYLSEKGAAGVRAHASKLRLVPEDLLAFLKRQPDSSIDKLYLSNVAEWFPESRQEELFSEVVRVGRPKARVCYRALMLDRPLPVALHERLVVDHSASEALAVRDRAFINAGFHIAVVTKPGARG